MNPFELFSLPATPKLDLIELKSLYLERVEQLHPDRIQGDSSAKEEAGKKLAEWNLAFETLASNRSRLALLYELLTGSAPSRTGRVVGSGADRLMKIAEVCRRVDLLLNRRKQAQGAIEVAMLSGEIFEATDAVGSARSEIEEWETGLELELEQLQQDWASGKKEAGKVEQLYQFFSYADKARKQLEERFLKLAESLG